MGIMKIILKVQRILCTTNWKAVDSLLNKFKVKEEHAAKFGHDYSRYEEEWSLINTFSSELLEKSHLNDYKEWTLIRFSSSISNTLNFDWNSFNSFEVVMIVFKLIGVDVKVQTAPLLHFDEKGL
jgi:hypothetical protein